MKNNQEIKVSSKCMSAYKYNENESTLDVTFNWGGKYRYYNVPNSVSHKLKDMVLKNESIGTYFNSSILPNHHCEKLN